MDVVPAQLSLSSWSIPAEVYEPANRHRNAAYTQQEAAPTDSLRRPLPPDLQLQFYCEGVGTWASYNNNEPRG